MDSERRRMGWGEAAVVNCCAEQPFFKGRPGLGKAVLSLPREICSKRTSLSRPLFRNEEEAALLKNCDGSRVLSQHQESAAQIQQYPTQYPLISSIVLFALSHLFATAAQQVLSPSSSSSSSHRGGNDEKRGERFLSPLPSLGTLKL